MNGTLSPDILLYALLGGIIPAWFWLKFWLREETHQEPRGKILGTFLAGMFMVLLAIPSEALVSRYFQGFSIATLSLWAIIEESLKLAAAYFIALRTRFVDEPIDPTIYLVSAALGFAAMENMFFLMGPLIDGDIGKSFVTINLRFLGATLLHIICSISIGIAMGYTFFKSQQAKRTAIFVGLFIATLLHTAFNSFIIKGENSLFEIFSFVWVGMFVTVAILHKIKKIKNIQ